MTCCVDGCDRTDMAARQMCWKHYLRWNRHGDVSVNKIKNYKAGRYANSDGYVMIHMGGNAYVGEHVLMAEKALGRPLPKGAEVHHVDRDGLNNNTKSPWNLVVCPDHAYHILLHQRARMLGYEPSPQGKLTASQAAEIRQSRTPQRETAKKYGISKSCVAAIRSGKIWKPLTSGGDHS